MIWALSTIHNSCKMILSWLMTRCMGQGIVCSVISVRENWEKKLNYIKPTLTCFRAPTSILPKMTSIKKQAGHFLMSKRQRKLGININKLWTKGLNLVVHPVWTRIISVAITEGKSGIIVRVFVSRTDLTQRTAMEGRSTRSTNRTSYASMSPISLHSTYQGNSHIMGLGLNAIVNLRNVKK